MGRVLAVLAVALLLTASLFSLALAKVERVEKRIVANAIAWQFEDWDNRITVSANLGQGAVVSVWEDGVQNNCVTDDPDVLRISPGQARLKATLDEGRLCSKPISVDIRWKAVKSTSNHRTHDNYWDPPGGCNQTADHVVENYWHRRAATSGTVDGEAFEGNYPTQNWLDIGRATITHCVG